MSKKKEAKPVEKTEAIELEPGTRRVNLNGRNYLVTETKILGTDAVTYAAWEPSARYAVGVNSSYHTTVRNFDGVKYGDVSTRKDEVAEEMPPGEARIDRVKAMRNRQAELAYRLIGMIFPDLRGDKVDGRIYVHGSNGKRPSTGSPEPAPHAMEGRPAPTAPAKPKKEKKPADEVASRLEGITLPDLKKIAVKNGMEVVENANFGVLKMRVLNRLRAMVRRGEAIKT